MSVFSQSKDEQTDDERKKRQQKGCGRNDAHSRNQSRGHLVALESKETKCFFCGKHQLSHLTMERESMFCSKVSVPCGHTGNGISDAAAYGDPAETFCTVALWVLWRFLQTVSVPVLKVHVALPAGGGAINETDGESRVRSEAFERLRAREGRQGSSADLLQWRFFFHRLLLCPVGRHTETFEIR